MNFDFMFTSKMQNQAETVYTFTEKISSQIYLLAKLKIYN